MDGSLAPGWAGVLFLGFPRLGLAPATRLRGRLMPSPKKWGSCSFRNSPWVQGLY